LKRVLLVEPDSGLRARLRDAAARLAYLDAQGAAPLAKAHLLAHQYDWLVTNVRLEAYNGLHLAYLARSKSPSARILIYGSEVDLALAREAQGLGAFYESRLCIARSLGAYLRGTLPSRDRRDLGRRSRRGVFRGGRRCTDITPLIPQ
jgi:DNA-binding NtrC family response regulator